MAYNQITKITIQNGEIPISEIVSASVASGSNYVDITTTKNINRIISALSISGSGVEIIQVTRAGSRIMRVFVVAKSEDRSITFSVLYL